MKTLREIPTTRALIWGSVAAVVGFLVWADWAELDQITRASAQVITSSRNQVIQVMEGGVLVDLPVREGAAVKRGQLLARFDRTKAEASYLEGTAKMAALKAAVTRLNAEIFGHALRFPPELDDFPDFRANQQALFRKRQNLLAEEIGALEKAEALINEELEMNLPLLKNGDVSRAEIIKLQRQLVDVRAQKVNKKAKYLQDCQAELVKAEEDLAGILQIVAQRKEQLSFTEVVAPMDGVVRNVRLTTLGGVAKPGEEIMQIVPADDDLVVEAKVKPSEIAFVTPGLPATVKLDAYDYSIYGALPGTVTYISADTLNDETRSGEQLPYYRVHVKTAGSHFDSLHSGKRIDVQPGMTATVEIKTGSKTVLRYLTKPITKTLSESLGER